MDFHAKNADHPIQWRPIDGYNQAIIVGHDPTIPRRGPTLSAEFARPILIGASSRCHVLQGESSIALT